MTDVESIGAGVELANEMVIRFAQCSGSPCEMEHDWLRHIHHLAAVPRRV